MATDLTRRVVAVSLVVGAALWLVWIGGLVERNFSSDVDGNVIGVDYSIFHTAGKLVVEGDAELLYELAGFNAALADVRGEPVTNDSPHFLSPPGLAYGMAIWSLFPPMVGWALFGLVGVVALAAALSAVGVERYLLATGLFLLSLPGWLTVRLGQTTFAWVALFSLVLWLLSKDRQAEAGVAAGLLALKPQFAAVIALWWLLTYSLHRVALRWLIFCGGLITVVTFAITPGSVTGFLDAAFGAVQDAKFPIGFTLNDTILGLAPDLPDVPVALIVAALGVAGLVAVMRRFPNDHRVQFAAVTVAAVWIPPHLIAYDWALLGLAVAVMWVDRPQQRASWLALGAGLAIWAAFAWLFAQLARDLWGVRLELAAVGLAVAAVYAYRALLVGENRTIPSNV